ncbi:MAG: hypothetical protein FJ125_17595, partial [Deltaproteobacteria bacterium]|nr:hypothetical protein [Deltaproteobacteria bacterium]
MRRRRLAVHLLRAFWLGLVLAALLVGAAAWLLLIREPGLERLAFTIHGEQLELLAPDLLGLLAALPLLWLSPLLSLSDLPWPQRAASLLVRTALLALLVLALTRPAVQDSREQAAAVILADVSDSLPDAALARQQAFVEETMRAAGESPVHVISFAVEPQELARGKEEAAAVTGRPGQAVPGTGAATGGTTATTAAQAGSGAGPRAALRLRRHPDGQ